MGVLRIMSRRGDDCVAWDERQAEKGDPAALAAVREAERVFREQQGAGATTFRVQNGRALIQIEAFDPAAEQIVAVALQVEG